MLFLSTSMSQFSTPLPRQRRRGGRGGACNKAASGAWLKGGGVSGRAGRTMFSKYGSSSMRAWRKGNQGVISRASIGGRGAWIGGLCSCSWRL